MFIDFTTSLVSIWIKRIGGRIGDRRGRWIRRLGEIEWLSRSWKESKIIKVRIKQERREKVSRNSS